MVEDTLCRYPPIEINNKFELTTDSLVKSLHAANIQF